MSTPVRAAHEVDADVETVYGRLTSPDWPAALDARLRDGSAVVERTETGNGGVRLVTRRRLPEGIPSFLRRFAPQDGTVTQTDVWGPAVGGVRTGSWEVAFAGAPGRIGGTTRVEPSGTGSRWVVEGSVTVQVPLVGGRAEAFLAPLVEKLVGKQADVLRSMA